MSHSPTGRLDRDRKPDWQFLDTPAGKMVAPRPRQSFMTTDFAALEKAVADALGYTGPLTLYSVIHDSIVVSARASADPAAPPAP